MEYLCYYPQINVKLALQLLGVHRRTLSRYVKEGKRLAKKRCFDPNVIS